ncbi:MAG: VCBS repeat-containing protein [Bacteroidetes bacterium]|nr:VCBS repeat-containing protein [Bacteroidota bacterium]
MLRRRIPATSLLTGLAFVLAFASSVQGQQSSASSQPAFTPRLDHRFAPHSNGALAETRAALPDTVRVLALMVDFQEDDDTRTSGTGKFGTIYEYDYGTEILDPLPHDRTYFQRHVQFLENYVRKTSGWKTFVRGEVIDGVVTMPKLLADYSYRKGESEAPVAQFAVDAWALAAAQFPSVAFGDYHMFVIFHAGRGRDIDLVSVNGFDPTPLDIPSLSFTPDGFRRLLGASFDGVSMPDGSRITNCAVLPTTNIREIPLIDGSTGLLELTINGLLAASFGTWAGLPDLFDTQTGKTGIGRFGLMDGEGIFAYGGIAPPEPSAWEKQMLGWTVAREAMPGKQNYILTSSDTLSTPDVLRVPITNREYWLLENRQRDRGNDGQLVTFVSGGQVQQVRFPKDTLGFENSNVQQLKGVIIDVEDYDWALPGGRVVVDDRQARVNGGILVWHVDENIIEANRASNTVNTGKGPKGVDLEQAGGPQDIGKDIQTVFGTETGTGSALDYWTRDNISPVYTNRFDAYTFPNTRANSGAFTHVTLDSFSASGPVMNLDIALGDNTVAPVAGWPVDLSPLMGGGEILDGLQAVDIDDDGVEEILAVLHDPAGESARLLVFRQNGQPFLGNTGVVALLPGAGAITAAPAVGDIDGDGVKEIVLHAGALAGTRGGDIWILSATDSDNDGSFDLERHLHFPVQKNEFNEDYTTLQSNIPQILHGKAVFVVLGTAADTLYRIGGTVERFAIPRDIAGVARYTSTLAPLGDGMIVGATDPSLFIVDATGSVVLPPQRLLHQSAPLRDGDAQKPPMVSADFTGDGQLDFASVSEQWHGDGWVRSLWLYAIGSDGGAGTGGPQIRNTLPVSRMSAFSVADVDGDGRADLLVADSSGSIAALNYTAAAIDDYPLSMTPKYALAVRSESGSGDQVFAVGTDRLYQILTGARAAEGFPIAIPQHAAVTLLRTSAGRLGIAASTHDGRLYLFETGRSVGTDDFVWKSRYADARNSMSRPAGGAVPAPIAEFFPPERCYNWPNPVYNNMTRIRFYVAEDALVTVKIYDLAGDKVDELHGSAIGGTDNEIPWNVSGIQSDTYLAHVEVTAGGKKGEKIIKIAVVK